MVSPVPGSGLPGAESQRARRGSISFARAGGVRLREQPAHGHLGEARVGHVAAQVGVGQFLRLDLVVQRVGRLRPQLRQRKRLHDVEHLERRDALAVGRQFVDLPAAVLGRDRRHPLGLELGQVGGVEAFRPAARRS